MERAEVSTEEKRREVSSTVPLKKERKKKKEKKERKHFFLSFGRRALSNRPHFYSLSRVINVKLLRFPSDRSQNVAKKYSVQGT